MEKYCFTPLGGGYDDDVVAEVSFRLFVQPEKDVEMVPGSINLGSEYQPAKYRLVLTSDWSSRRVFEGTWSGQLPGLRSNPEGHSALADALRAVVLLAAGGLSSMIANIPTPQAKGVKAWWYGMSAAKVSLTFQYPQRGVVMTGMIPVEDLLRGVEYVEDLPKR